MADKFKPEDVDDLVKAPVPVVDRNDAEPPFGTPEHPRLVGDWPASPTSSPLIDTDGDLDAEPIA